MHYKGNACRVVGLLSLNPHRGGAFEPLQMLVRARKSMHSNRDKRDLVLDNSGCLCVHYSLDRRDTVTTAATAEVYRRQRIRELNRIVP